jgi:hypothetical protein
MQKTDYPILNQAEFDALPQSARLVEIDQLGPKVLMREDTGQVIKIFYQEKHLFRRHLFSLRRRGFGYFLQSTLALQQRQIRAPEISAVYRYENEKMKAHIVFYDKIPGLDLYHLLTPDNSALLREFLDFWVFALIDVEDCYFYDKPLNRHTRLRNIRHVLARPKDQACLPDKNTVLELYWDIKKATQIL